MHDPLLSKKAHLLLWPPLLSSFFSLIWFYSFSNALILSLNSLKVCNNPQEGRICIQYLHAQIFIKTLRSENAKGNNPKYVNLLIPIKPPSIMSRRPHTYYSKPPNSTNIHIHSPNIPMRCHV